MFSEGGTGAALAHSLATTLRPAEPAEFELTLAHALRFDGRKAFRRPDKMKPANTRAQQASTDAGLHAAYVTLHAA